MKLEWQGRVISVQPRIRLWRSFDEVAHSYHGYNLRIFGTLAHQEREYVVAIGKSAQAKNRIQIDDQVSGLGEVVADQNLEIADINKVSGLKVISGNKQSIREPPPFVGVTPDLTVYRERGHRRLDVRTFTKKCNSCIWGCEMPVEITIDKWKPHIKRFRRETFCYGPKSCPSYKSGPTRKVPGRNGMSHEEESWIDEQTVAHRGPDD